MARQGGSPDRVRSGGSIGISSASTAPRRALALLERPDDVDLEVGPAGGDDPENLFVPVVPPTAPLTPGLGQALGVGRRLRQQQLREADRRAGRMGPRWWESQQYAELTQAVEEAFADPSTTGELVRPYIDFHEDGPSSGGSPSDFDTAVWAGVGVVPPPTPVYGVERVDRADDVVHDLASPLPSRRELRRRRKAETSARTAAARKLAKGTVLAMTMFGVVASNAPQALHDRIFGDDPLTDLLQADAGAAAASLGAAPAVQRDSVEGAVRERLVKAAALQSVSQAGQNAGAAVVAAAKAQAAADAEAARVAMERAHREAQRNPRALARLMVADRGWSSEQFTCLDKLWMRESGWRWNATNPSSGAYGIPQSLPASKMANAGSDYRTNPATQMEWGLDYIDDVYGTPCAAWGHSQSTGWY